MENRNLIPNSESLGGMLKRARELRGISLEEVAAATHVRLNYLRAIEQNQLDQLPGLIFLKGYVRAYVEYIGLDLNEVMVFLEDFTAPRIESEIVRTRKHLRAFVFLVFILGIIFLLGWFLGRIL